MPDPILDNHCHLDHENGRGIEAVKEFARSGGTHLLIVNKPSWQLGINVTTPDDFHGVFKKTVEIVKQAATELQGTAWPVLGVHPALISKLVDDKGLDPSDAKDLMCDGLNIAAEYVTNGPAIALKSGRPHYDVTDAVWDASNDVLRHALSLGSETGVAVQLHTETTDDLTDVADWAEERGLPPERVVKHYASGQCAGITPSVISKTENLRVAAERGDPFLMETDFLDDPDRPGAVLGLKTVPRRTRWLQENGFNTALKTAHIDTPLRVYGIDTTLTA